MQECFIKFCFYLDVSLPFFEVDGYDEIEDEMTQVFDATHECPKKDLDQNKLWTWPRH